MYRFKIHHSSLLFIFFILATPAKSMQPPHPLVLDDPEEINLEVIGRGMIYYQGTEIEKKIEALATDLNKISQVREPRRASQLSKRIIDLAKTVMNHAGVRLPAPTAILDNKKQPIAAPLQIYWETMLEQQAKMKALANRHDLYDLDPYSFSELQFSAHKTIEDALLVLIFSLAHALTIETVKEWLGDLQNIYLLFMNITRDFFAAEIKLHTSSSYQDHLSPLQRSHAFLKIFP